MNDKANTTNFRYSNIGMDGLMKHTYISNAIAVTERGPCIF